ncbi:MAG: ferric iron uptake transcriptional regulator [Gammaproteobacteria bacterium]|nr:ferric iron uptake transcriptional regulator [Gammaproteobacteria bacterium]
MDVRERLKSSGLRVTGPRLQLLQLLIHSMKRHWHTDDLYQALLAEKVEIGLATVYRTLAQFESVGLVQRHRFEGGHAVFELAERMHHDHLVCIHCGTVKEFMDEVIEARQQLVAERENYILTSHALNLYGVCGDCRGK